MHNWYAWPGLPRLETEIASLKQQKHFVRGFIESLHRPQPTPLLRTFDLVTNWGSNFSQISPLWVNRDRPEFIFYIDQLRFYQQNSALKQNTNLLKVIRPLKSLAQMFPLIQIIIVEWEGGTHDFIRSNYYHIDLPLCEQINFKLNKLGFETIKLAMINFPQR